MVELDQLNCNMRVDERGQEKGDTALNTYFQHT